jgi:hypothetical protein
MSVRVAVPFIKRPGLTSGTATLTYTAAHGTSPGTAILVTNPQSKTPQFFGILVFGGGCNGIRLQHSGRPEPTLRLACRMSEHQKNADFGNRRGLLTISDETNALPLGRQTDSNPLKNWACLEFLLK